MSYCIAINALLRTDICPLQKGQCYWQHTINNRCCYTDQELTPEEFCELTGKTLPSEEAKAELVNKIKQSLKDTQ